MLLLSDEVQVMPSALCTLSVQFVVMVPPATKMVEKMVLHARPNPRSKEIREHAPCRHGAYLHMNVP